MKIVSFFYFRFGATLYSSTLRQAQGPHTQGPQAYG